LLDLFFLF